MREILDHGPCFAPEKHILPPLHTAKTGQVRQIEIQRTLRARSKSRGKAGHGGVTRVEEAMLAPFYLSPDLPLPAQIEAGTLQPINETGELQVVFHPHADAEDASPWRREQVGEISVVPVDQNHAGPGHDPQQVPEAALYILQITKNIGMVELQIVQRHDLRAIVDKLAALVEKGRVILVALDDKGRPSAQARPTRQVARRPANQPTRRLPCPFQQVGGERRSGRLAMRARDHHGSPPRQHGVMKKLRQGDAGQL